MAEPATPASERATPPRLGAWLAWGAVCALLGLQALSIQTASIHWDELGLLHLADLTLASGELEAGGRPGLAVAMLLPLVEDCVDEMAVIHSARWLWLAINLGFLAGLFVWLGELGRGRAGRWWDALLGVALLVLPPAFLDASLQVRSDQIALAGGAWGGAALLLSTRRPWWALFAGVCFGVGMLGSQKVIYVGALAGLLALGQIALARDLQPRREVLRLFAASVGMAATLLLFRLGVEASFVVPETSLAKQPLTDAFITSGFSLFDFYRNTIGWREYRSLAPELLPHLVLTFALALASLHAWRRHSSEAERLGLAWAVLALGACVALFHAAAFRYFWLTLGLFPAVAFTLARRGLLDAMPPHLRRVALALLLAALAAPAMLHLAGRLSDAQAVQRRSFAFVHRNFARDVAGFHPESGLFCLAGAQPLPTFFSQHIYENFENANRERNVTRLIERFRDREVAFLMQSFRLNQFPAEVRRFWEANYQPYSGAIFVAGRRLAGAQGERAEFELVVSGRYRWLPLDGPQPLEIGGRPVAAGGTLELEAGPQHADFVTDVPRGLLVLALNEAPSAAPLAFYGQP